MDKDKKRKVDLLVISDVHLGTYGCRAKELLNYLKSVNPKTLVLNGDIIDIWQFSKRYFPKSHMKVIKYITSLLAKGTKVYYVTGNHDEMLRKFKGFSLGSFEIVNKLIIDLDGKKCWIFHGDVFDVVMKNSKWLAQLGGLGYDLLILINTFINWVSMKMGRGRLSLSKKVKNSVKSAVKFINDFEETVTDIAMSNEFDQVVCGHIHQPQIRMFNGKDGQQVMYLNSGDWIENLTALEYKNGKWSIYHYAEDPVANSHANDDHSTDLDLAPATVNNKELFNQMIAEFQVSGLKKKDK